MSDNMFNDLNNDDSLDNINFDNSYNEDYDFISEYEQMMEDLDNQEPIDILPSFDENDNFYEAVDNWDNDYVEEISEKLTRKGKRSYDKYKEDENEFKKEFAEELTMLYDLLDDANKFNKKLIKKYDSIDGSKAKGTSKYLNDLIASVLTSNTNKLQIIKEITNLKKTIQELKIKSDGKYAKTGDDSLESQANSFFSNIMSVGRNNFISALNGDDMQFVDVEYSSDTDIEYANTLPDVQNEIHDRINERLMNEDSLRSTEAEKYIIYENLQPEYKILRSAMDNTWEVIAVDKDGHRIHDYPVPSKKDLGRMKFSSDGNYATDAYGRSYKVIEHYGI
jgi:hypothetical protein